MTRTAAVLLVLAACGVSRLAEGGYSQDSVMMLENVTGVSIELGRFLCESCNSSKDCGEVASRGRRQVDSEWRLWRPDGRYREVGVNVARVCLRKWMLGCNGPVGPEVCNSYTEVCTASEALYHEGYRVAPHELQKLPIMLSSVTLIVFSFLTFFSPYFTCGVVGVFIAVIALVSHSVSASLNDRSSDDRDHTERAQKWLVFATVATFFLVYTIWGAGYPNRAGLSMAELGKECADFYNFFVIDQRLMGPAHNKEIKYWGYCEREYVADTLWNVTAVIWLGFLLGGIHLFQLGSISFTPSDQGDDHEDFGGAVAGGPGTFLIDRGMHNKELSSLHRHRIRHDVPSVQSYNDIRLMISGGYQGDGNESHGLF